MLDGELKRAVRSQNFLTFVMVEAGREQEGMMVADDDTTLQEVAPFEWPLAPRAAPRMRPTPIR